MKRMISDLMKDYFDEAASTASRPHQVRNLINESAYHNLPVNAALSRGEWETVVLNLQPDTRNDNARFWYTAATRAKKLLMVLRVE